MVCFSSSTDTDVYYYKLPLYTRIFCFCVDKSPSLPTSLSLDNIFTFKPTFIGKNILIYGKKNTMFPYQCLIGSDWPMSLLSLALIISCTLLCDYYIIQHYHFAFLIGSSFLLALTLWFFCVTSFSDPGIVFKETQPPPPPCSSPIYHESSLVVSSSTTDGLCEPDSVSHPSEIASQENSPKGNSLYSSNCTTTSTQAGVFSCLISGNLENQPYDEAYLLECGHCELIRPTKALHCPSCGFCIDELDHHCPWTGKCIGKKTIKPFFYFLYSLFSLFFYLLAFLILYIVN